MALQKNLGGDNQLGLFAVRDTGCGTAVALAAALPDFDKHQLTGCSRLAEDQIDFTTLAAEIAFYQLQSALLQIDQRDILSGLAASA